MTRCSSPTPNLGAPPPSRTQAPLAAPLDRQEPAIQDALVGRLVLEVRHVREPAELGILR